MLHPPKCEHLSFTKLTSSKINVFQHDKKIKQIMSNINTFLFNVTCSNYGNFRSKKYIVVCTYTCIKEFGGVVMQGNHCVFYELGHSRNMRKIMLLVTWNFFQ